MQIPDVQLIPFNELHPDTQTRSIRVISAQTTRPARLEDGVLVQSLSRQGNSAHSDGPYVTSFTRVKRNVYIRSPCLTATECDRHLA